MQFWLTLYEGHEEQEALTQSKYSKRQIKHNNGLVQANCATKEILIPKWVISIPISIMFINFTMLTFYSSKKPPKLWILAYFLSEWQTRF